MKEGMKEKLKNQDKVSLTHLEQYGISRAISGSDSMYTASETTSRQKIVSAPPSPPLAATHPSQASSLPLNLATMQYHRFEPSTARHGTVYRNATPPVENRATEDSTRRDELAPHFAPDSDI